MPSATQIVPEHDYAFTTVVINDNSARPTDELSSANTTYCNCMFVFSSPKGRDNELQTLSNGLSEFVEKYGIGSYDDYGQPFLNAYAAASTNAATLHCLRVTADDATYAVGALVAHYKVTPGTSPEPPQPTPSDKVNTNGHENVLASDEVDLDGTVKITIAGTDVEPGISADNAAIFGEVTGNYIDITLDLGKVMTAAGQTLDNAKTYQVTQVNPALQLYDGKDEYVSNVEGQWTKVRTYSGADLAEGYAILVGSEANITLSIVEWGTEESTEVEVTGIVNTTDLGVQVADAEAGGTVTDLGSNAFQIALTGECISATIHPELWGTPAGKNVEVCVTFPAALLSGVSNVTLIQKNANLEQYSGDPTISNATGSWVKSKSYAVADISDGYAILVGEGKGDVEVKLFNTEGYTSEEESTPLATCTITNGYTFVDAHTPEEEPEPGPIGDPVDVTIDAAISYSGATTRSAILRAVAKSRSVLRKITPYANGDEVTGGTDPSMDIYYTFDTVEGVTDSSNLGNLVTVDSTPNENGYSALKLFEVAAKGRGTWGNNIRFVINSYARGDRLSNYKNYTMSVYEISNATMTKKEEFTIAFNPDAVNADGDTLFAEYVITDPYDSSDYIDISVNPTAFKDLFAAYVGVVPDTSLTYATFDPLCGMMFGTSLTEIDYLHIDTASAGTVSVQGASGIALMSGDDGSFRSDNPNRQAALNNAYLKAYSGEIDRNVRSKKMYPTDIFFDAGFDTETKIAMAQLVEERQDCVGIFDLGTNFNTYAGLMENLADIEVYLSNRSECIEGYWGKIQDPVSFKIVPVTATYPLCLMYPVHFQQNGGKHVPLAGSSYAIMSGFISGTAYPVYDDDLDSDILDTLTDSKVNFLKVNSVRQVVRGAQTTRQDADTNLSELSNVMVLNDIRHDAVQLCEQYEYNFAEASDLQRFNKAAGILADKYQDAQVSSISAEFSMNDWESERGILHLYIDFVHKNIIKRSIVEIDVNRGTVVV